jgi:Gluconate 2-dehydrogenase subunit 3
MSDIAFTEAQRRVLAHVLDDIIPASPDGQRPAAGQLGAVDYLDRSLNAMPELKAMIAQGVDALDALARSRHPHGLDGLPPDARAAVLAEHAGSEHSFPPILIMHTFAGYYQDPRILTALGMAPRAPHPEGYEMDPGDLSLLEPVRRRGKLYREC